jgi:hypothetical protein
VIIKLRLRNDWAFRSCQSAAGNKNFMEISKPMDVKKVLKSTIGWGFVLWLIGYALSIVLIGFVPVAMLGWILMPIGAAITIWVVLKKIERDSFTCYIGLAVIWTIMAIVLDYLFIVKAFKPADGYYKPDVYLYYALTLIIPIAVGFFKTRNIASSSPKPPST